MKPILRWQYNEIEGELALLQGHLSDPSCPCESEGEHCPRKHYMLIKKLATETLPMEPDEERKDKLVEVADQAREFQQLEEQKLCEREVSYPQDPLDWAREQRKLFESILVGACDLEPVAMASTPTGIYPSGCELVDLVRDKCHSQSPFRTAKGCDIYLTELFGQECRGQPPGHILGGKLYQIEATCELVASHQMHLLPWFEGYEAEALFAIEPEEKGRKIDEVMKRLQDGIQGILESENYQRYLLTMAKFHRYSLGNIMLIAVQREDATRVAGYVTWKELGRWVKKGETGIAILAPCLPPKPKEPEVVDEEEELLKPEPRPIYFKVVYVFDVKQTEGEELPIMEVPTLTGEVSEALWQRLLDYAASQQVPVSFESQPGLRPDIKGSFDPLKKEIWIKPDESRAQQAKTLTHELAHHDTEPQPGISRGDHETIAESVAFAVCAHFGFDTGVRSFPYVALWAKDMEVLRRNLAAVTKVTTGMIDAMEVLPREEVAMSEHPDYYEVDGSYLSKVHGIALSKCEVELGLVGKLDSCVSKVQEKNIEAGCPPEGLGTAECPLSYAICRASISQPVCGRSDGG